MAAQYLASRGGSSPRVRGTDTRHELTPRVRGTGALSRGVGALPRFIPAGAGNSERPCAQRATISVHPRGCGEQYHFLHHGMKSTGSSPRVRGTATAIAGAVGTARFIPAGAGNSFRVRDVSLAIAVHPRGCGEQFRAQGSLSAFPGSSPRVRGTAYTGSVNDEPRRFIPAGAGNRAASAFCEVGSAVHPRGCGEQVRQHPFRR